MDGGGSKGVYTLGVLKEIEAMTGNPLCETFQYVYGTSTGSIIAALIGLGYSVEEMEKLYYKMIPKIMTPVLAGMKSIVLDKELTTIFKDLDFTAFKTGMGIVATNINDEKPLVFKSSVNQAYQLKSTFAPGFGCTIVKAVLASCAAYPLFKKVKIRTSNQNDVHAMDGGFIANNPILFAIADVLNALKTDINQANFVSIGTGNFVEKSVPFSAMLRSLWTVRQLEKILKSNANTIDILAKLLFKDIIMIRINDSFNQPQYGTNMLEKDLKKLRMLNTLGRNSFATRESALRTMLMPN